VVSHDILLKKLEKIGIRGTTLQWFKSYLSERKQKVDINGNLSNSQDLKISVLQGTILGPILFLCYINDLPQATNLLSRLFANDTACTASHSNLDTLINLANTEIQKLQIGFVQIKWQLIFQRPNTLFFMAEENELT
jgi:hypothetical protein